MLIVINDITNNADLYFRFFCLWIGGMLIGYGIGCRYTCDFIIPWQNSMPIGGSGMIDLDYITKSIKEMSKEDWNDLIELFEAVRIEEDKDEQQEIVKAIKEIIEQEPIRTNSLL